MAGAAGEMLQLDSMGIAAHPDELFIDHFLSCGPGTVLGLFMCDEKKKSVFIHSFVPFHLSKRILCLSVGPRIFGCTIGMERRMERSRLARVMHLLERTAFPVEENSARR